eukprot:GEZU01019431.1.p1 GENE.GEZU01019431.1~~GEZU01019431.1.p1  ORF type:complete len:345 (+),score=38.11 GEZU01019431.1:103-1137(+)
MSGIEFSFPSLPWYEWVIYSVACLFLVLFAGVMSGLTLGLLSIDPMQLKVLLRAGTDTEKEYAKKMTPILKRRHLLLVTLLLCNALAMETLPLFLDRMGPEVLAILLSVTFVLVFGEIIPQAVCSRYGLAIGGKLAPFVLVLMGIMFPISWPISKFLDMILGKDHIRYLKRSHLIELVSEHEQHVHSPHSPQSEGGPLLKDEVTVIRGALELNQKTVGQVMTPLHRVFMLSDREVWDEATMRRVLEAGHSRIPVYRDGDKNDILGLLIVKKLVQLDPVNNPVPISAIPLREIPIVSSDVSLWDMLNEFQKGKSHLAMVRKRKELDIVGGMISLSLSLSLLLITM